MAATMAGAAEMTVVVVVVAAAALAAVLANSFDAGMGLLHHTHRHCRVEKK